MLKFPYGICDFYRIQTNGYFYVDRTEHIRLIEDFGDQLIFLRPRRFGKSLLLSMLENYYDVAKADEFDKLFGHLAIGKNPTPQHNQYFVMKWDFSRVEPRGDVDQIRHTLHAHVNARIKVFSKRYQEMLPYPIEINDNNAISSFESLLMSVYATPYRLYLLIDEYDNFANELMIGHHKESPSRYETLLSGEGAVKTLFKTVKSAAGGDGLERVFVTGVSPVVFSDMSSGYNVALSIYLEPEFNDLCGFSEVEIQTVLKNIAKECDFSPQKTQEALDLMRTFYNGYCFSLLSTQLIYNPTLALYFLNTFQKRCQFPTQMLDDNLGMDKGKLSYIAELPYGEPVILQALNEEPPLTVKQLANSFGVEDMLSQMKDTTFMISLLYYFGILTLNGEDDWGEKVFKIPNLVMRKLYVEKLKQRLLPELTAQTQSQQFTKPFYQTGDLQPICDFMEQRYFKVFDNRDYKAVNELTIKTAFLTILFDDQIYLMDSETELERRYADLSMILRPERQQLPLLNFLLEFKYISLKEMDLTGVKVKALSINDIKALDIVQTKLTESKKQLIDYHHRLKKKYGPSFKLTLISVVACGFERVVWEKVVIKEQG